MKKLNLGKVRKFVNANIGVFHNSKLECLKRLNLKKILKTKNPYLFRAKNIAVASDLIREIMDAYLCSAEEKLFGDFLEDLAVFVSEETSGGRKSAATGIDLEFVRDKTQYLVSIKSGPNWGNSSQQKRQEDDFKVAIRVLKQSKRTLNVLPVLGICYGKTKTAHTKRGYMKIVGQSFWHFISENENLYTDIIEPLGCRAKQHNEKFSAQKASLQNQLTQEFMMKFCVGGSIDWKKLVKFNSGNLDLQA